MNIAGALKAEVSRISAREIRRETAPLKKSSAAYRREIAALKRHVQELERKLQQQRRLHKPKAAREEAIAAKTRFSAKSMASQRKRLGLSVPEIGRLIGASTQSVYNWEEGKIRPRAKHLEAIYALRKLGRRQANEILAARTAG